MELTWAKRALDSSHCPITHCQACLLHTALQDTRHFFGSLPTFFLALYLFFGWTSKMGSRLLVRTSCCCFALQIRDGKQQPYTHTHTHIATFRHIHSHKRTPEWTLKPSMCIGACRERSSHHANPWLWVSLFATPRNVCAYSLPIYPSSSSELPALKLNKILKLNVCTLTISYFGVTFDNTLTIVIS